MYRSLPVFLPFLLYLPGTMKHVSLYHSHVPFGNGVPHDEYDVSSQPSIFTVMLTEMDQSSAVVALAVRVV